MITSNQENKFTVIAMRDQAEMSRKPWTYHLPNQNWSVE